MNTVLRHSLSRLIGQILGWGLTFALLGWITTWAYNSVISQQTQWQQLLDSFPPQMMAFFGEISKTFTPDGYLDVMLFSYAVVILAFFGVIAGSGMLASDEEAGRLDLIQAYPVSRPALFWGRLAAMTASIIAILALTWAGCAIGMIGSKLPVSVASLALPLVPSFAMVMLFAGLALWLSMMLPSRTLAASTAAIILVASYAVTSLARVIAGLKGVARLSPLNYYQSGSAINGINWTWLVSLLVVAALLTLAAWWAYQRHDLRVSGEGNWQLPGISHRRSESG